jgi:hypothetical protein
MEQVTVKNAVFLDVTPCILVEVYWLGAIDYIHVPAQIRAKQTFQQGE